MLMRSCLLLLTTVTLSTVASAQTATTDWPRWRGAAFDGTASTGRDIFSKPFDLRIRWTRRLGPGYSGVVVAGGRAVTMFSDGRDDVVVALSTDDGKELWRVPLGPTFPGKDGSTGGPVSTAAIDDGTVYALGPRGNLVAIALAGGRTLWARDLVQEFGAIEPQWGFTTSPLIIGDLVVTIAGGTEGGAIVGLNRRTGELVWKAGEDTASYPSPVLTKIDGRDVLIAGGDKFLFAIDPRSGREIWRREHGGTGFYGRIINPVVVNGGVLLTSKPDTSEFFKLDATGATPTWTTRELKLSYASPVVHNGIVFGYSGSFLTAIDGVTGALKWRSRPPGDGFPIIVDGHLVVLTKQGQLAVAEASGSGFTPKATIQAVPQLVWTPPAFAEGRVFARDSYENIVAVDVVPASRTTDASTATTTGVIPSSKFAAWVAGVQNASDAQSRVAAFLADQKAFPIIEGDRYAHIVYTGDGRDLLLRSDALGTGVEWPLNRVGQTDLYYVSLELEPDSRISYQFAQPFGAAMADERNPLKATSQNFVGDVSLLLMPRADPSLPTPAALRGRVMDLKFESGSASAVHLRWGGPRDVHVYLPPGYDADAAQRYPTVYVMYGAGMLREAHLAAALEADATIRPSIVVFVETTSGYEYARSFRDPHARMMAERLVPWVDGQFRTLTTAAERVLIGGDEAGFAAVEIGLRYPSVFGNIIGQSLFPLSAGDAELLARIDKTPQSAQRYHIDWGKYDPRRARDKLDVPGFSSRVLDRLRGRGFTVSGGATHDGSTGLFWADRVVNAMQEISPAAARSRR
jgi:outer membrane protein assembly factor BamB